MTAEKKIIYEVPEFTGENVPISVVAKVMKKDAQFIREALKRELLPIGTALKKEGNSQYDYYVSPRLLWEYTGYVYRGR